MRSFTLYSFKVNKHSISLVLPETWQAPTLFEQLKKNHKQFSKYLKWANNIDTVQKEANSIKIFQQKMVDGTNFNLVILIDGNPAGMIDLHHLTNESGEVGYWLSSDYQHLGIMTKCVEFLIDYSFTQLKLNYLLLRTAQDNSASQNVALRTGFKYEKDDELGRKVFKKSIK